MSESSRNGLGVYDVSGLMGFLKQSVVYGFEHLTIAEALSIREPLRTEKPTLIGTETVDTETAKSCGIIGLPTQRSLAKGVIHAFQSHGNKETNSNEVIKK